MSGRLEKTVRALTTKSDGTPRNGHVARWVRSAVGEKGALQQAPVLRTEAVSAPLEEKGPKMTLEADPPRHLWATVTIEEMKGDQVVKRQVRVPFEQSEVDAISEARKIADEFGEIGERGVDGAARMFWGEVLGMGMFDSLFPTNAELQNRADAIWGLQSSSKAAERAIEAYRRVISDYKNGQQEAPEKFWDRLMKLYNFKTQIDQMKRHEEE